MGNKKVSVVIATYNQEKYIRKTLESIVSQKADFEFEAIVGDDCSTDGNAEIIREFAEKYPDLVAGAIVMCPALSYSQESTGNLGQLKNVPVSASYPIAPVFPSLRDTPVRIGVFVPILARASSISLT